MLPGDSSSLWKSGNYVGRGLTLCMIVTKANSIMMPMDEQQDRHQRLCLTGSRGKTVAAAAIVGPVHS